VSLCVVEVYPLASNAALGKPTTASNGGADAQTAQVRWSGVGGRETAALCPSSLHTLPTRTHAAPRFPPQVVNGNMANTACATVVSDSALAAWITIDLGYDAPVEAVVVQNGFSIFRADLEVRWGAQGGAERRWSGRQAKSARQVQRR
jgi:hypothetical protein